MCDVEFETPPAGRINQPSFVPSSASSTSSSLDDSTSISSNSSSNSNTGTSIAMSSSNAPPPVQKRRQASASSATSAQVLSTLPTTRQAIYVSPHVQPIPQPIHMYSPTTYFDPNSQQYLRSAPQPMYYGPNGDPNTLSSPYIGPFYYIMPQEADMTGSSSRGSQTTQSPSLSIPSAAATPNLAVSSLI